MCKKIFCVDQTIVICARFVCRVFGQDVGMRLERWMNEVCASVHGVCEVCGN
jgi:hypothetical protein